MNIYHNQVSRLIHSFTQTLKIEREKNVKKRVPDEKYQRKNVFYHNNNSGSQFSTTHQKQVNVSSKLPRHRLAMPLGAFVGTIH